MKLTAVTVALLASPCSAAKRKPMFAERFLSREQISEAEKLAQDRKRAMR